jgi:hypothetical protein
MQVPATAPGVFAHPPGPLGKMFRPVDYWYLLKLVKPLRLLLCPRVFEPKT